MSKFKKTEEEVKQMAQDAINEGRQTQVEIGEKSTFSNVASRLTDDDVRRMDKLNLYRGVSANSYDVKMSVLWTSLFWKIGEQIMIVGNFNSPFMRFFEPLTVGADIEEVAPRVKEGLDRQSLSNSALLANYITQYDNFIHRVNQFKVWASTYDTREIGRISNTWANVTNMINAELENIVKSANIYMHDLAKDALTTSYLSGAMDSITIPAITNADTAADAAIIINNVMDLMQLEANTDYIPFNRNSTNTDPTIKDIATSNLVFISKADLLNNILFRSALNLYFGKEWENDKFNNDVIKVTDFNNQINPNIQITPGYTPLANPGELEGFLVERNALIFRNNYIGTFNFDNGATLKTSMFHHIDALTSISDRRKCVAIVRG